MGNNLEGQTAVPPDLSAGGVMAIAAGGYHDLALKQDGTVVAWGAGEPGQSAEWDYGQLTVPDGLNRVVAIAAGLLHSLALKQDGTVAMWGTWLWGSDSASRAVGRRRECRGSGMVS